MPLPSPMILDHINNVSLMICLMYCWIQLIVSCWGLFGPYLIIDIGYNFPFCGVFVWFCQGHDGFLRMSLGAFLHAFFLVSEGRSATFLWMFDEFCLWNHLVLDFYFNYSFNSCLWMVSSYFLFILVQSWRLYLFYEFVHFFQVAHILLACSLLWSFVILWC